VHGPDYREANRGGAGGEEQEEREGGPDRREANRGGAGAGRKQEERAGGPDISEANRNGWQTDAGPDTEGAVYIHIQCAPSGTLATGTVIHHSARYM